MTVPIVDYTSVSAGTVEFAVPFPALLESHIKAQVNLTETGAFSLDVSLGTLTFDEPTDIPEDATVTIYRDSVDDDRLVNFEQGATIRESDLDTSAIQNRYIAEEGLAWGLRAMGRLDTFDETLLNGIMAQDEGAWDAELVRLKNLAEPTAANDAVRKTDLDQVVIDGGGVTPSQRSSLDASIPLGGADGPEFRCLLSTVDVQSGTAREAGFYAPVVANGVGSPAKVAHFYVAPHALDNGGMVRLFVAGRISGETDNPILQLLLKHNGTTCGADDAGGSLGYYLANATIGKAAIARMPSPTRWTMDVEMISLGRNADEGDLTGDLGHNMLVRGEICLENYSTTDGDISNGDVGAFMHLGLWETGLTCTAGKRVTHHGVTYVSEETHTSSATDEPSVTEEGQRYWTPVVLKYRINHMANWDHDALNEVTLDIGPAFQDDPDGYSAWSSQQYNPGDGVSNGGNNYICINQTANPDTAAPTGNTRFWRQVSLRDEIVINTAQAYFLGAGSTGLRPLS